MAEGAADPVVSVVIPVYNAARYLKRALESVQAQTYPSYEMIVVDDGSTDDPAPVLQAVAPEARYVPHAKNAGLSAARNTGIRQARGRYIAFLDADDSWEAEKLAAQVRLFEADGAVDFVFSDFVHVLPNGDRGRWQGGWLPLLQEWGLQALPVCPEGYRLEGPVAFELIRQTSFIHPSTVVVRREAFERVGYFDEQLRSVEDLEMWIRLAVRCRVGFVNQLLVQVEQRADSLAHNYVKMSEHILKVYGALQNHVTGMPDDLLASIRTRLASEHRSLGWQYFDRGDVQTSRSHYWASLHHHFRLSTLGQLGKTFVPSRLVSPLRRLKGLVAGQV